MNLFKNLKNYLVLIRIHRTTNFLYVLLGLLYASNFLLSRDLILKLGLVYLIFAILLYGGIYSLNSYVERFDDLKDGGKRHRLIPSGKVSPREALFVSVTLILASFFLGYLLLPELIIFQLFFLGVNLLYSLVLKRVIPLLAIFTVALTGPTRFVLGYFLLSQEITLPIPLVHYLCSVAYHSRKFAFAGKINPFLGNSLNFLASAAFLTLSIVLSLKGEWLVWIFAAPSLMDSLNYHFNSSYRVSVQKFWDKE